MSKAGIAVLGANLHAVLTGEPIYGADVKGSPKGEFKRVGKTFLKALAVEIGISDFDIRFNPGGIAVSGELMLHTDRLYVCFSQPGPIMYRRVEGRRDYGKGNNWLGFEALLDTPSLVAAFGAIQQRAL